MVNMPSRVGDIVLPGDVVRDLTNVKNVVLRGPGLHTYDDPNSLLVTQAGILRFKAPNMYWIDGLQKRYYPKKADLVVGIVVKKSGEVFKVDIGSSEYANLSLLAFEGATKKQKPDLQVGDAVYARVLSAHREMEPDLVCVDSYFKAGKMGHLSSNGFIINLSLNFIHKLLDVEFPLLRVLGKPYIYEIAVGVNGKVWINANTTNDIFSIMNALLAAEHHNTKDIVELCRKYQSM